MQIDGRYKFGIHLFFVRLVLSGDSQKENQLVTN